MKILLINYEYPPLGGGGGVAAAYLAEEWVRQGHSVDVLTTRFKGSAAVETVNGVRIFRVPVLGRKNQFTASMLSLVTFPILSIIKGIQLCMRNKYDVFNTHFVIPSGPTGAILSALFRIPNILSIHGGDIYDPTKRYDKNPAIRVGVRSLLRAARRIVAQSSDTKEKAERIYALTASEAVNIIPLGFRFSETTPKRVARKQLGLDEHGFYFIGLGRMVKRKGFQYAIEALPEGAQLLLVGDGAERQALEEAAGPRVHFTGSVSEDEKWLYLAAADAYVLSSEHEGFAIVCIEAMHCGLPMIATNNGGQTDYLRDTENALLVKPGDVDALRGAMQKVVVEKPLREELAAASVRTAQEFSIDAIAAQYINMFVDVTQK